MYLIINNNRYSVSRRMKTEDTVRYLTVEPAPEDISGKIRMFRNDGFLMSEDNADDYERHLYEGTLLTITNVPEPTPPPEPGPVGPTFEDDTNAMLVDHEYRLTLLELGLTDF